MRANERARRRRRAAQAEEPPQIITVSVDNSFFSRAITHQKTSAGGYSLCAHGYAGEPTGPKKNAGDGTNQPAQA